MKKRIVIAVAVVLALGIGVAVISGGFSRKAVPVYQGKTAEQWILELHKTNQMRAFNALHAMGSNTVPAIVHVFEKEDSRWDRFYQKMYPELPYFLRRHLSWPVPDYDWWSAAEMAAVDVKLSKAAVPDFVRLLEKGNSNRQTHILVALVNYIDMGDTNCLPVLMKCLQSTNENVCLIASIGVGRIGPKARDAVPAVTNLLQSYPTQKPLILDALKRIDPDTAAKYGH